MKKLFLVVILMLVLAPLALAVDTELWSTNTFQFPLLGQKFNVIPELRFKSNMSEWYYLRAYIGPTIPVNKTLDISVFAAPSVSKSGGTWSTTQWLGYLDLVFKPEINFYSFSNRSRFEQNTATGALVYRDQLAIKNGPWSASEELFYHYNNGFVNESRAVVSYAFNLASNTEFSVGYLMRHQKASAAADWAQTNVLNLGLKIKL